MKTLKLLFFGMLFALPAFGQGTVNPGPQYSVPIYPNTGTASTVGPSNISTDSTLNNLGVPGTTSIGGPNPYVDTSSYKMRAVSSVPQTTATCTGGTENCTLGSATGFQVGDGIVIYGAGGSNGISIPGTPTVTPSLRTGPDIADVAAAPTGSTGGSYQIVARGQNGNMSAASSAGSTSTGWSLGPQQVNVSGLTRSSNMVTVATVSAINCAVNAIVFITNSTDPSFSGMFPIHTCNGGTIPLSTTAFTYLQGMDTRAGATTAATGGTAQIYNGNYITWSAPTMGIPTQYYIYKSGTLLGATRANETYWLDLGVAAPTLPDFVPTSAPGSGTTGYLATTITSITGTAITIATNALNSTSSTEAKFDDAPTFLNAYAAAVTATATRSTLHISAAPAGTNYYFNSAVDMGGTVPVHIIQEAPIVLNETMSNPEAQLTWSGVLGGTQGNPTSNPPFPWGIGQNITVNSAYPGVSLNATGAILDHLNFTVPANGLGLLLSTPGAFNFIVDESNFFITATDITGQAIVSLGAANHHYKDVTFSTNDSSSFGYSLSPIVLFRNDIPGANPSGDLACEHCYFVGRGFGADTPNAGGFARFIFQDVYAQALRSPLIEMGNTNSSTVTIRGFTNDTTSQAAIANWNSSESFDTMQVELVNVENSQNEANGPPGILTGLPVFGANVRNGGAILGQNANIPYTNHGALITLPAPWGEAMSADYVMAAPFHFPAQHTLFWDLPAPPGLTCTAPCPATGGGLAAGTNTYQVTATGADGGETTVGNTVTCVTTSGSGTCNLSWTPVAGATSYNVYWDGLTRKATHITTDTYSDSTAGCCNTGPSVATGTGSTTVMSTQVVTPQIVLSGPLSGAVSFAATINGSFTANRHDALPDSSGTVSLAADYACGATSTCAATLVTGARTFYGDAALASGSPSTVTIIGFSPAFTSTSTFECTATDNTSQSALKVSKVSTSSITITGPNTVTDDVSYICKGS
jgi:hypothetical protein